MNTTGMGGVSSFSLESAITPEIVRRCCYGVTIVLKGVKMELNGFTRCNYGVTRFYKCVTNVVLWCY